MARPPATFDVLSRKYRNLVSKCARARNSQSIQIDRYQSTDFYRLITEIGENR